MTLQYATIIDNYSDIVAEEPSSYRCLTERHLQVMWLEQKYFRSLKTREGAPIHVVSPGCWNAEAGPDFRKAHLVIDGVDYFGDVEIHLFDEGWKQHRHHRDPNYDNVILHIALWAPKQQQVIATVSEKPILCSYFQNAITIPHSRIVQLIDLDLYPYERCSGAGRCGETLFRYLSEGKVSSFFRSAARWRLQKKYEHLSAHSRTTADQAAVGIAAALGYKNNSSAFIDLYHWLCQYRHRDEATLYALALKGCGFFNEHYQRLWGANDFYNELKERVAHIEPHVAVELRMGNIRPHNHPIRRLAYLSKMIRDPKAALLPVRLRELWDATHHDTRLLWQELVKLIPDYKDDYWNFHYTFNNHQIETHLPLVGVSLKQEMVINTFLPILYSYVKDHPDFDAFYSTLATASTGKSRYLSQRFFGDTQKSSLMKRAEIVQGSYQLHHDFCIHYETSCSGCPFAERYKNFFKIN